MLKREKSYGARISALARTHQYAGIGLSSDGFRDKLLQDWPLASACVQL